MNSNVENPADFDDLAVDLMQAVPPLPADALERVRMQMRAEMDRADRRRLWRSAVMGSVLAASVAIAIIGYAMTYGLRHHELPVVVEQPGDAVIDERIRLAVRSPSIAPVVDRPLVRLDENLALFMD